MDQRAIQKSDDEMSDESLQIMQSPPQITEPVKKKKGRVIKYSPPGSQPKDDDVEMF